MSDSHIITGATKERSYKGDYMAFGKKAEKIVMDWLRNRPGVVSIVDYRNTEEMFTIDSDCGVVKDTGKTVLIEIKGDAWLGKYNPRTQSRNILCEVLRINHNSSPGNAGYLGWTFRSSSKYIFYYAPNWAHPSTGKKRPSIYGAKLADVQRVIQIYTRTNPIVSEHAATNRFDEVRTDCTKTTFNILIPEEDFKDVFTIIPVNEEL